MIRHLLLLAFLSISLQFTLQAQDYERGKLVSYELTKTYTIADIEAEFASLGLDAFSNILPISYAVDRYTIIYKTPDVNGTDLIEVSGAMLIPQNYECYASMLNYNHGTMFDGAMTDGDGEFIIGLLMSTDGYVSALPDYIGYGASKDKVHPYIIAKPSATTSVDMIRAARQFCREIGVELNDDLFVAGYSEGGFVAMATLKEIQELHSDEIKVTIGTPMSGPYQVFPLTRDSITSPTSVNAGLVSFVAYAYNAYYDNMFDSWSEIFKAPYDDIVPRIFNPENRETNLTGQLPAKAFDLFQPDFYEEVKTNDNHPFNVAMAENNIYDWVPEMPLKMYYCEADEQVSYVNALATLDTMLAKGADPENVTARSMGATFMHAECAPFALINAKQWFDDTRGECRYVGMEDLIDYSSLYIYPNPVQEVSQLVFPENDRSLKSVQIYDVTGRLVKQWNATNAPQITINSNDLSSGVYVVEVKGEHTYRTKMMVD